MQTPFAGKLHTNYVPQGPEVDEIHQVIAEPLKEISQLNEKILRLQATINDLSRRRDELSKFVEDHRVLLSGVRRLPEELIQQIFLHCLPTKRNAVMSSDEAPVLLGRICKSWRQISSSFPQLWSSLHIPIPDAPFLKEQGLTKLYQRAEIVKAWLERSGCCPLSLSVTFGPEDPAANSELPFAVNYLLHIIACYSMRWKDVDFYLPFSVYDSCLSGLQEADVPVLEKIRLRCFFRYTSSISNCQPIIPMFQVSSLRQVDLCLRYEDYTATNFVLCWECITHLSLVTQGGWGPAGPGIPMWKALEVLENCPRLVSCRMEVESQPLRQRSMSPITLPCLCSLEILEGTHNVAILAAFFEALSLPHLQHFKYSGGERYGRWDTPVPFKSIITPSIESLELDFGSIAKDGLISECLPFLPSLKRLNLLRMPYTWGNPHTWDVPYDTHQTLDNDFLALLTPSPNSMECLCPKLEEIRFEECRHITDEALCAFLMARARSSQSGVVCLKRVEISFDRLKTIDIIPQLTPFLSEGLQVHLDYVSQISTDGPCSPWRGLRSRDEAAIWPS